MQKIPPADGIFYCIGFVTKRQSIRSIVTGVTNAHFFSPFLVTRDIVRFLLLHYTDFRFNETDF